MRLDKVFWSKAGLTAVLLLVARAALRVPLPGLDGAALTQFAAKIWPSAGPISQAIGTPFPVKFSAFALGVCPYVAASIVLLVLSGLIPALRRLRQGTIHDHERFDRLILFITVILCLIQGYGISNYVKSTLAPTSVVLVENHTFFTLLTMATVTGGCLALVWVGHLITRHGMGNGILWLLIVPWLHKVPVGIEAQVVDWKRAGMPAGYWALMIGFTILVFIWGALLVRARRNVEAEPDPERMPNLAQWDTSRATPRIRIPIRINLVGTVPIIIALQLLSGSAASISCQQELAMSWREATWYWLVLAVIVVALTYVMSAWVLNVPDLLTRLRRWGYRLVGEGTDQDFVRRIESMMIGAIFPVAISLVVFAALPHVLLAHFRFAPEFAVLFGHLPMVLAAVGLDICSQNRCFRRIEHMPLAGSDGAEPDHCDSLVDMTPDPSKLDPDECVALVECETELDVELIRRRLLAYGCEARWEVNRIIPVTGSLGPWEICRPSVPSLVIHRRLGGGVARVRVKARSLKLAREILGDALAWREGDQFPAAVADAEPMGHATQPAR